MTNDTGHGLSTGNGRGPRGGVILRLVRWLSPLPNPLRWGALARRLVPRAGAVALLVSAALFLHSLDGELHTPGPSHLLLDRRGAYLGEVPGGNDAFGYWPLPAALPEKLVVATLETEDRSFYEHGGVSLPAVARAAWQNATNGRVISGASTIAMQVARLQHPKSRSALAKLREAAEARLLVARHGHDKVLRQYLTLAPYGNRTHGAARAARLYFDKPLEDLSWLQAAYLAALPQQPGRMSPWTKDGQARALKRARAILYRLRDRELIDDNALQVALKSDLLLAPRPRRRPEAMHAVLALSKGLAGPGVVHHTTLDLEVQRLTHRALTANLERLRGQGAGNTAGLVVDLPTGDVLAYVGSADYFDEERRGAIDYLDTRRSPGSTLKPFIYAMALERGTHTAATEVPDTQVSFPLPGGRVYVPENITHNFLGPMLLRQALGNSRNIPALRVLSDVGVDRAVELFERGGVKGVRYEPDAYGLALAIGALHLTPKELATLFTALAHQGETVPLRFFADAPARAGARLVSREAALLTAHILADGEARRPGFSAGGPLDFDYPVAIKTGTSQGNRDAWAAAFSDRLLVVTWVGNHDWRRMHLASGATAAAPALHAVMDAVMPLRAPSRPYATAFPLPPGAVTREVCALSGRRPGPGCTHLKSEYFIPGTEPVEPCPFHVDVPVDVRTGLLAGPGCPRELVVTRPMLRLPEAYAPWARRQHLAIAPTTPSPLCAPDEGPRAVAIREPVTRSRYLFDPDTPRELSTVRFAAAVSPPTEDVVWLVDGTPVAKTGYPHELRWPMEKGRHVVRAAMARSGEVSEPVMVVVED